MKSTLLKLEKLNNFFLPVNKIWLQVMLYQYIQGIS